MPKYPTEFLEISAEKRTDDRRNKVYHRTVSIIFTDPRSAALGRAQHELRKQLTPSPSRVGTYDPNPQWPKKADYFKPYRIHLTFVLAADKPSLIVSEGEAIFEYRAVLDTLCEQINTIVSELEAEDNSKADRERVAEQATRLAKWIGAEAKERALAITRFEQRLAGLKAELEVETATQLKKFEPEADKDIAEHNAKHADDLFTDEEMEIAKAHAAGFAKHRLGGSFLRQSPTITPEEVAEHRGEATKESA